MDPVLIYGIAAGGIFVFCFLYYISSSVSCWIQDRTFFYILKYLVYPVCIRRTGISNPVSRWDALLTIFYWLSIAVCNVIGVRNIVQASNRAGALAVLHFIPLLCSNRLAFVADLLGLSLPTYTRLHAAFGMMALMQTILHTVISVTQNALDVKDNLQFYGLLVRSLNVPQ